MQNNNTAYIIFGLSAVFLFAIISFFSNSQSTKSTIDDLISMPAPSSGLSQPGGTTPVAQPSQNEPDPTTNWKAYAIPFLKIALKIPPGWFIATDETDKNRVRILSTSPQASPEAVQTAFKLDINKLPNAKNIKNVVDLRIELTKSEHNSVTQKGKIAGENEVKIDNLPSIYRELQTQSGAIQQLYLITTGGEVGIFESVPKDENQINIFKIIISTIRSQ